MEATEPGESPSTLPVDIPSNEESTPVEIGRGFLEGTEKAMTAALSLVPGLNESLEAADDYLFGGPIMYKKPTTTAGEITSTLTQTLWGGLPAMKFVKTMGVSNVLAQSILGGAVGDFVVGDEDLAKGLLDLIDMLPADYGGEVADRFVEQVNEWAEDPEAGGMDDLKARLITSALGVPLTFGADRVLKGMGGLLDVIGIAASKGKDALGALRDTIAARLQGTQATQIARVADENPVDAAFNAIGSRISRDGKKRTGVPGWDQLYTSMVNKLYPVKKLVRDLANGREVPISFDPYKLARLQVGATNKANLFLEHEVRSFRTGAVVGPGLRQILRSIKGDGKSLRRFGDYLVAKRAKELMTRDKPIKTGLEDNIKEIDAVLAAGKDQFDLMAEELVEYQNNVLKYLSDSGIISKRMLKTITEANKDYVPFFRLLDDEAPKFFGKGVRSPVRKIKGSEREIIDPLESVIKNTYLYVELAERNGVVKALHGLAKSSARGAELVKEIPTKVKPIKISGDELERAVSKADPGGDLEKIMQQYGGEVGERLAPEEISIFRAVTGPGRHNQVSYFNKGKKVTLEVDPEVATALKGLDEESIGLVTRIAAVPARMLRAGAILDPEFFVRNAMRDNITAAVYSNNDFRPWLADFASGLVSLAKKDKHYKDWLYGGGAQATLVSLDRIYLKENLKNIADVTDLWGAAGKVARSPLEIFRVMTAVAENATRIGEFKQATKGTVPTKAGMQRAAFEAREITLDFARRGSAIKGLNMVSAFLNARIQGYDRLARAMMDNPKRTVSKAGMYITTPSVLFWMHNNSTDERRAKYKAIPEWQKNMFWVIVGEGDTIYRIPKPFELGVLFGSVPERILDAWAGNRKIEQMPGDLMKSMGFDLDSQLSMWTPTAAKPVVESQMNYSFFRGRDLIPGSLSDDRTAPLPQDQYTLHTSEVGKKLSQLFGESGIPVLAEQSPIEIDNYIANWTGGLGRKAVSLLIEPFGAERGWWTEINEPEKTLADIEFVKGFVIRYPDRNAQPIVDFYERSNEAFKWINSFKMRENEGDLEGIKKIIDNKNKKTRNYIGIEEALREQREDLASFSSSINMIYRHPTLDKTKKREMIDNQLMAMLRLAEEGNQIMDDIEGAKRTWSSLVGRIRP